MIQGFQRFRIPPDFDIVELHKQASYLYMESSKPVELCPCCEKLRKEKKIPYCKGTAEMIQLGEEIPMLFFFLKATCVFLFFMALAKFGDFQICNLIEGQCDVIYAEFTIPSVGTVQIPAGFKQNNDALSFGEFVFFVLAIIVLKIIIKMKKYKIKWITKQNISNRALKLINVHKDCEVKQIKEALMPYKVDVILTYRVKAFEQCLLKINKLLKMKKMKQRRQGSFITETQAQLNQKINIQKVTLQKIKHDLKLQKNRLSIVFVVFTSSAQRKQAYNKLKRSLVTRLFYKLCTCCSETNIRGQSFTVKPADDPADIIWTNLENPYLRTKIRRLLSIFVCIVLLAFGVGTQYLFTQTMDQNTFAGPLIKSLVVLILNFIIVTLLQYSTENLEHYESHTQRHLTLVHKMTAFLFVNISLSPLLGYYFSLEKWQKQESIRKVLFANFCFSVLVLAIGNISKPFPLWLSVERVTKALGKWMEKRKGNKCVLTQIQANKQFQPIEFPISAIYSLALSSLLMVCFYVNAFQMILLIQMVSLIIMYFVAKWMLLRVCRSPAGLARRISNLAQSLLRVVIFIYWLGKVLLTYINLNEDQKAEYDNIFGYMFRNAFGYVEFILAILCLLFLEFFVKWISKLFLEKSNEIKGSKISQSYESLVHHNEVGRDNDDFEVTYENANLHLKLEQQCRRFEDMERKQIRREDQRRKKTFR